MPIQQTVQQNEGAIEVAEKRDLAPTKTRKLAKSKEATKKLTAIELQENQLVIDSAQAGYNSPVYAAAGSAFLQGGHQKFMETICSGYATFVVGVARNVGQYREPADFDVWNTVETTVKTDSNDSDVWA